MKETNTRVLGAFKVVYTNAHNLNLGYYSLYGYLVLFPFGVQN